MLHLLNLVYMPDNALRLLEAGNRESTVIPVFTERCQNKSQPPRHFCEGEGPHNGKAYAQW